MHWMQIEYDRTVFFSAPICDAVNVPVVASGGVADPRVLPLRLH